MRGVACGLGRVVKGERVLGRSLAAVFGIRRFRRRCGIWQHQQRISAGGEV